MRLFDASIGFGTYRTTVYRFAADLPELVAELDYSGIERALAYHTAQRWDGPVVGNERIVAEFAGQTRVIPTWTLLPSHTREMPTLDELLAPMASAGVAAIRLFPEDHRYSLDDITWGDQLELAQERNIPIFIKASVDRIADLMRSFPELTVITGTQGGNPLDRYAYPLVERFPNLHFEYSSHLVDDIIEDWCERFGPERLLYASGYPDSPTGASLLMLARADIGEDDRAAIAAGNLERLLARARLA